MQKLAGCIVALERSIARSRDKALPFFKLMKKMGTFAWTPQADKAFAELKQYLTSPPVMVAPKAREPLLLYLATTPRTTSEVLVTVQKKSGCVEGDQTKTPRQAQTPTDHPAEGGVDPSLVEGPDTT